MKVHIRISYGGKAWVYHEVSEQFWNNLQKYLDDRPYLDTIAEVSPY